MDFKARDTSIYFAPRERSNSYVTVSVLANLTDQNGNQLTDENGNHFVVPTTRQARPVVIHFKQRDTNITFTE